MGRTIDSIGVLFVTLALSACGAHEASSDPGPSLEVHRTDTAQVPASRAGTELIGAPAIEILLAQA